LVALADSVVPVLRAMGTLEGPRICRIDLNFDGTAQGWLAFNQHMLNWTDSQNVGYMLEGHGICNIFQAASAASAELKAKATGTAGTISLDIETYAAKDVEAEFKKTSVLTSEALAVRGNRKEKLRANWADHEKCGMSEDGLIEAHNVLDVKYLREVNRSLARTLHDTVLPGGAKTTATTKLRSILKTPQVVKIIAGEDIGGEEMWPERPWMMPGMQLWGKLTYRLEGMTKMINGTFMDDLSGLLSRRSSSLQRPLMPCRTKRTRR
jgi:hypothetical protein